MKILLIIGFMLVSMYILFFLCSKLHHEGYTTLNKLVDFMKAATKELLWLSEREEAEVSRDWSARNLNMADVQEYYEVGLISIAWSNSADGLYLV